MTPGAAAPRELELQLDSAEAEQLALVGPALAGAIYRSRREPVFYRLIPIDDMSLADRQKVKAAIGRERKRGFAPIVGEGQPTDGQPWYFVRYGLAADATMADVLARRDPRTSVKHAALMLAAFHGWTAASPGLVPMPAEIAFGEGDNPELLPMPHRLPLDLDSVTADVERAWYVAPELLRGLASDEAARYAAGVTLLRCFYELPSAQPHELLERVANGTLLEPDRLESSLPSWLAQLDATRQAVQAARDLTLRDPAARAAVDTTQLAERLAEITDRMQPAGAVRELRESGRAPEAFSLLQDVLLEHESYDLLMLGGTIAAEDVDRPLEGIDLLERAIAMEPTKPAAYEKQLAVILMILSHGVLGDLLVKLGGGGESTIAALERRMLRDCERLVPERQAPFEEPIARCLVERERYDAAAGFVHPRLFEGSRYLWFKFGMAIAYAEALVGQGRRDEAHELLGEIKAGLRKVRENKSMPDSEVQQHGHALTELEVRMAPNRGPGTTARW